MASVLGIIKAVGTETVKIGDDVVHVVEDIGRAAVDVERVLTDANKLAPEVKAGLVLLTDDGEAVATALVAIGGNPANLASDITGVQAIEKLVKDFVAFLPTLKAAVQKLEADVT